MALVVVDTSVVIGWLDPSDGLHDRARQALAEHRRREASFVAPATVLAEVLVGAMKRGPQATAQVKAAVGGLVRITDVTAPLAEEAARLRASRAWLRLPDAIVVAAGRVLAADFVLTGDRRWG